MPGIDGYETCRRLKDDPDTRDAAVIFLSALDDAKDKVRGFEAGAVDFITKPFQGEEVLARVNTHLSIQRLLRRQAEAGSPAAPQAAATTDDCAHAPRRCEARPPGERRLPDWRGRRLPLPHRPLPRERRHGRALRGGGSRAARAGRAQDHPVAHCRRRALDPAVQARGAPGATGDAPQRLPHLRCLPPPSAAAGASNAPTRSCFSRWSCCTARRWPTSSGGMDGCRPRRCCLSSGRWPPA